MKHPSTEQARRDAYKTATAVLVSERVNRSTWQEKGRGEAGSHQEEVATTEWFYNFLMRI